MPIQLIDRETASSVLERYQNPFSTFSFAGAANRLKDNDRLSINLHANEFSWSTENEDLPVLHEIAERIAQSEQQDDAEFCESFIPYLRSLAAENRSPLWTALDEARRNLDSPSTLEHIIAVLMNLNTDDAPYLRVSLRDTAVFHDLDKVGALLASDEFQDHALCAAFRWRKIAPKIGGSRSDVQIEQTEWLIANHHLAEQIDKHRISSTDAARIIASPEHLELLERFTIADVSGSNLRFLFENVLAMMTVIEHEATEAWKTVGLNLMHALIDLLAKLGEEVIAIAGLDADDQHALIELCRDLGIVNATSTEGSHD
jgi:hypothetical protein